MSIDRDHMITNRIYEWARTQPAKTAMIHNDHPCSYAVFARAIEVTKTFFMDQSLPAGRTAIVRISNVADAWIVVLGLRSIGLTTIRVNSLATAKALNIKNIACIVMTQADRALDKLEEQTWAGVRAIVVPKAIYANIHTGDIPRPSNDSPPFGGHILYTSGTTGIYKKVLLRGEDEETRIMRIVNEYGLNKDTVRHQIDFALWAESGFRICAAVWHVGGFIVSDQREEKWQNFFSHKTTFAFLTTGMLRELLQTRRSSSVLDSGCELFIGSGFVPLELAKRTVSELTTKVSVLYDSTECPQVLRSRFRTGEDLHWLSIVADRTVQIVDEAGRECSTGQQGELRVLLRDTDATSYLDDEVASKKVFRGGYFYSGDIAVRRADGRIRILGRAADVLNLQGQKIAVAPVEQKIQNFLGVSAACLFSFLSDDGREELVIAIEANKAPPQSQLDRIAREFKSFQRVRFAVLREFPRTDTGMQKIKRTELREIIVRKGAKVGGGQPETLRPDQK
jgi:acyl-CoA synthetase (AMP-forming)/AMP-acid ligase II